MSQRADPRREFILQWADDKYVFGHQLASITGFYGPDLEENLALGSMAQDHLGHARLLYMQLAPTEEEVDRLVFMRPAEEYRTSLLAASWEEQDWAFVVVKGLLYAHAELTRARALIEAAQRRAWLNGGRIVFRDDGVHHEHWRQWLLTLSREPEGANQLQEKVDQLWPLCGEFFHEATWRGADAVIGGKVPEAKGLLAKWAGSAGDELRALGYSTVPENAEELKTRADDLARQGLCGREGRHTAELRQLLDHAHGIYRTDPTVAWG